MTSTLRYITLSDFELFWIVLNVCASISCWMAADSLYPFLVVDFFIFFLYFIDLPPAYEGYLDIKSIKRVLIHAEY